MIETTENTAKTDAVDPAVMNMASSEEVTPEKEAPPEVTPLATLTPEEMLKIDVFTAQANRITAERETLKQAHRALNAEESILSSNQGAFFGALQEKHGVDLAGKQINADGTVVDRSGQ